MSTVNTLCLSIGHDWRRTTADNYRVCQRTACHAAQRLVRGEWIDATRTHRRKRATQPETLLLWDERTLLTHHIHPQQEAIERQAEQRWHQFRASQ